MARRMLADSAIVAVGIMAGNVLSYGFSFALSHQLGSTGYGQIGALLALFLIASIPATALQAVTARRVATATAADGGKPGAQVTALAGPLIRWSVLVGLAEAVVLLVLSPALSAALPAISTAQVAWTAVSLLPYTVISGYFGLAQGTSRFPVFTSLFIAMNAVKFLSGLGVGGVTDNPTVVMGAVAAAWFAVCALCHYALRDLVGTRRLVRGDGYLRELGKASWGMGAALMLSLLDGLLSAHYYRGSTLGSYQAGALFTRAGYFGPQFVAILIYPRLAVPATRRTALRVGVAASVAIGLLTTGLVALVAGPLVRVAFGSHYTEGASFSLDAAAWLFALAGAVQALVQLVQLDAVARGSAAVGWVVLGGIAAELAAIVTFAHHSPDELITTAAIVGSVTAAAGLAMAARARHPAAETVRTAERAPAAA